MRDSFSRANAADFKARYVSCFGWFINKSQQEIPVYLDKIRDDTLFFTGMDGVPYHTYADSGVQFKFASIRKAIYLGADGELYCLQRLPARQWRRGISQDNTELYKLTTTGPIVLSINLETMSNIFNESVKSMKHKGHLSDMFAIVGACVYLYSTPIGSFIDGSIKLNKQHGLFKQDVMDAVRNKGYTYKVE